MKIARPTGLCEKAREIVGDRGRVVSDRGHERESAGFWATEFRTSAGRPASPSRESRTGKCGRSVMRVFRACPVRLPWRLARGRIHELPTCRIPWWQGKMQGISPIQPLFAKIYRENIC